MVFLKKNFEKIINPKRHISIPFDFLGTIKQIPLWKYPEAD